uniref:hypothetical protein n=1 Tax=Prevotella sp. TaxID=59823 RepID=UPI003FF1452F
PVHPIPLVILFYFKINKKTPRSGAQKKKKKIIYPQQPPTFCCLPAKLGSETQPNWVTNHSQIR